MRTAIAIIAGIVAALHLGKIPGALPFLTEHFYLSLTQAGLIVSSFSVIAATTGLAIGWMASRIGLYHAGILGLLLTAIGAAIGAISNDFSSLLLSRVIEGLGFVMVAVTMPGLINHVCSDTKKSVAMGIWGAFIPTAMSLMLVVSPVVIHTAEWQGLWWLTAFCSLSIALLFALAFKKTLIPPAHSGLGLARLNALLQSDAVKVVAAFICYSALFAGVTAFLPTFWISEHSLPRSFAAQIAAVAVTGNIAGNIVAGILIGKGYQLNRLLWTALAIGGVCGGMIFSGMFPFPMQVAAAFGFTFFSGCLPGATFASVRHIAPKKGDVPLLVGLIFQGAGIGQVVGPIGVSSAVAFGGSWIFAGGFILFVAMIGAECGRRVTTINRTSNP